MAPSVLETKSFPTTPEVYVSGTVIQILLPNAKDHPATALPLTPHCTALVTGPELLGFEVHLQGF